MTELKDTVKPRPLTAIKQCHELPLNWTFDHFRTTLIVREYVFFIPHEPIEKALPNEKIFLFFGAKFVEIVRCDEVKRMVVGYYSWGDRSLIKIWKDARVLPVDDAFDVRDSGGRYMYVPNAEVRVP